MARFLSDQNKLVFLWESGTYANPTGNGVWMGLVTDYEITENQNVIQTRFVGQGNRNVGVFQDGPLDVEGTITIQPQHWRHLGLALGSIFNSGVSANNSHQVFSEVNGGQIFSAFTSGFFNPWASFSLEESRTGPIANQNSVRSIRGAVIDSYTLTINQGEPVTEELGIKAQAGSWFSGATTAVTAGSNRPYLWSDAQFGIGGTNMESVKNLVFTINNNFEMPHYLNGSRVAQIGFPGNRDYTIEVTQDLDSVTVGTLWNNYFQGGSKFNATLDINASSSNIGSHRLFLVFSGCRMTEMDVPATFEGVNEITYTLVPGSVTGSVYDRYSYTPF